MRTDNFYQDPSNSEQSAKKEKLRHISSNAKTNTPASILAMFLCALLYVQTTQAAWLHTWLGWMTLAIAARHFLTKLTDINSDLETNFQFLNLGLGLVPLGWGIGWFIFVNSSDQSSYLTYLMISQTVLFVGMATYCINWPSFLCFLLPLKIPELIYTAYNYQEDYLHVYLMSLVAFGLAIKIASRLSQLWESSVDLRLSNASMIDQLTVEKNASIAANIAKSEFIATASHDLRQPMQSINIFVDTIESKNLPEFENRIFSRMRQSITVLNKMFNTLLDISKLDSEVQTATVDFSVAQLIADLTSHFSDLAKEKNLSLEFDFVEMSVRGDSGLTAQIFRNLLANALQYTDHGRIVVKIGTDEEGCLIFSVQDTGQGISTEDLPIIFREFFRSESARSHHDGLGLGLSIVNRIVQKIGAVCTVRSELGQGSLFTVKTRFPVSAVRSSLGEFKGEAKAKKLVDGSNMSAFSATIGIIENDLSLKHAYQQYFVQAGYSVFLIPHEKNAFIECLATLPQLSFILSDYRLAEHSGVFFIQKLREEFNENIPACIVTADTSPKHLKLFDQLNIDVLYKPVEIALVESLISRSLTSASEQLHGSTSE